MELRFCPWFLLFKYRTGRSDLSSSLCPHYVYLTVSVGLLAIDAQEAFFCPIAFNHLCCNYTEASWNFKNHCATNSA